jgi:hypothetical protein
MQNGIRIGMMVGREMSRLSVLLHKCEKKKSVFLAGINAGAEVFCAVESKEHETSSLHFCRVVG